MSDQQDFLTMSVSELHQYVLNYRDNTEAFHILIDRFHANPNLKRVAAGELDNISGILEDQIQKKKH